MTWNDSFLASFECCKTLQQSSGHLNSVTTTASFEVEIYLLLAECEVHMVSYGLSFFLPFMAQAQSMWAMKTRNEKTRIHDLLYGLSKRGQ